MASLKELLSQERVGLEKNKYPKGQKPLMYRERDELTALFLPVHICQDRKSYDFSHHKARTRKGSSRRVSTTSERSNSKSLVSESSMDGEPAAIDEVTTRAVVSILSGYVGRYVKDEGFRETIREKCRSCLVRKKKDLDNGMLGNLELGIESVEKLVEDQWSESKEVRTKKVKNTIRVLNVVGSAKSSSSHLSACAQLYLSIVHKIEKNDRLSARHLLQVFCDSASSARTHFLPDLWEHFFLPHLLHVKIWYAREMDVLSSSDDGEKEKKMKAVARAYDEQMDMGTTKFALYYKEWLQVGAEAPPVPPTIPLPSSIRSCRSSRRRSSDSYTSHSSLNKNLYHAVFGPTPERTSVELNQRNGVLNDAWGLDEVEKLCVDEDNYNHIGYVHSGERSSRRRSSSENHRNPVIALWPESETQKTGHFGFFRCQNEPTECLVSKNLIVKNNSIRNQDNSHLPPLSNLSRAISTIYSSDNLSDCESAIRVITKAWLDSHGDPVIEVELSNPPVIQGMLEVLFVSSNDEILELVISVLAELVARNEMIRQIILNSDPQLEFLMRLLKSNGLFLKAAILLYLLKPKAKQMISVEWVALVLRVLEFGDQLQTLFTVRCSPQVAALYLLNQLLTGFDEDRNLENAREVVSLGGLSLLVTKIERGETHERNNIASVIAHCVRADGSCRNYLADFLNKASLLELIVLGNGKNSTGSAIALLIEMLCLSRRTKITEILNGLKEGSRGINTMQILLVYLQRAPLEERLLIAVVLLQLDLMGDPFRSSVYREEAIEAIVEALSSRTCSKKVQQRSSRALLMLGGRFSYTGEASTEQGLLQQAGYSHWPRNSFHFKENVVDGFAHSNEDEAATENWQRKTATVLFKNGNRKLLVALSDSMANGIPSLARSSLVTVSWMSRFVDAVGDEDLGSMACSVLVPQLLESLNYDRDVEERVLASYTLLNLAKSSVHENVPMLSSVGKELLRKLQNLSLVTWTANELISIITSN
ncbi:putative E3 ubiquitin-protein ligase LIN isoform X2 [Pyrus x bretschneideri]|uniref:putative E3 ubiquitin-protein ligase LIN isoform X2 n=1 Tax=Pyrus x bretschneideri TaxID=225117 RepID=UPI00202F4F8A|nr:putative E3 ubiquitin-protein ligase LIN isoform X2 [Pyrus x bretschneideri]